MAEMSMNKAIHGAFRRDLRRLTAALESFEPGDLQRASRLAAAWTQLDDQLTHHHTGEHELVWPTMITLGFSPALLATFDSEHEAMAQAIAKVRIAFDAFERDPEAEHTAAALAAVRELTTVTNRHLDHEEDESEEIILAKDDTPEMKALHKELSKMSPADAGRFFAWVTDGATPDELAAVKHNVPGPILTVLRGVFGRGYRKNIASVWTT